MVAKAFIVLGLLFCLGSVTALPQMPLETKGWKSYDVVKDQSLQPEKFLSFYNYTSTHSYNFEQLLYLANIGFGTPAQDLTLLFDSGSATVWVMGPDCTDIGCHDRTKFYPSKSSTFDNLGRRFSAYYGNASVNATLASDTMTFGDFSIHQVFGVADQVDAGWTGYHFSGLCGMSRQHSAQDGATIPLVDMYKQGKIPQLSFSLHLSNKPEGEDSKIIFGGVDSSLYEGELTYFPVIGKLYWAISLDGVSVGSQALSLPGDKIFTIVDSGTTTLSFPLSMIGTVQDLIGHVEPDCSNVDSLPALTFTANNHSFHLYGSDYVVVFEKDGRFFCNLPFVEQPQEFITLGVMFIRRYYTHFDMENQQVGFALNKH